MVYQQTQGSDNGMEKLIYAKDWTKTPLGAMEEWPHSLQAGLHVGLTSESPSAICWGKDYTFIFNEAWKYLFEEDPGSLGLPARKVFDDRWENLESYFKEVLENGEVKKTEQIFTLPEKAEQNIELSLSPIYSDSGSVEGVFIIAKISKRYHKAEKQIVNRGDELEDFFDNAPIGIHWLAADGIVLKVNQTELDMLGYSREEFVGHNITEFYVNKERIIEALQKLKEGEEIQNFEGQMIHKDGYTIDISLSSNVYRKNGDFVHTRCFTRDITDQKRWQRKLQETENRYRTLVDNFPKGAVGLFDKDLRYTAVGGKLLSEVGIKQEDRIGSKITDIYPDELVDELKPHYQEVFKGGSNSFEIDFHNRHLLGHTLPIKDDEGDILSGMLVVQDITERWQAQQELRESEARFRMMAENLNEVIWMVSEDGKEFIYINPAFEKVWGIDRQKLYDKTLSFLDSVHPEDRDRIERRYTGQQDEFDDTYRIIRPDGEVRWLHSRGSKVHDQDAQITRIIGIAEDITKRKEAQKELEEINATLEERVEERTKKLSSYRDQLRRLASQLNRAEERERRRLATELHDRLGQMLAVAKMKVEGLGDGQFSEQPSSELEELKEVVNDALAYNQNLMVELKPPPVLNKEDVTEVLVWTANQMEKEGLDVTVEDDGQSKPVDEELRIILYQSVRELFQNVIKHSGVSEARMEISRQKNHVKVTIEDKGKGFEVSENWLVPTEAGKFGLFNIKERMDWHGGAFEIHSIPDGTEAVLYVPLKEEAKPHETAAYRQDSKFPSDPKKEQGQQKVKVLLVDDHEMVRRGLHQMIEKQEDMLIVGEASHGQEAVELARESMPDVIIMDVNMPVMDGIEATHKIKGESPSIQIIGLSLHESEEVNKNMQSAGASAYLTKNEAFESLITTIRAESSTVNGA